MAGEEMLELKSFSFVEDARQAEDLLKEAGIPCFLADEQMGSVSWGYASAFRGVRLMVPRSHFVEAAKLLESFVEMRETEVSEEELADQAEQAGRKKEDQG